MKVVIITGGGSGIGAATAQKLVARGDCVLIAGRDGAKLNALADAQKASPGDISCCPADVSKPEDAMRIINSALQWKGRIDAVINCAGLAPMVPTYELTPEQWHQIIDTNLSSVFYMTRAVWPVYQKQFAALKDSGQPLEDVGVIINLSSQAARDPFAGLGAYGAAKAGINLLTRATAREGREIGVRVIAIAPGAVDTVMFRSLPVAPKVPARDILNPSSVADTIVAAIDGALRHASGEAIYIHRNCF